MLEEEAPSFDSWNKCFSMRISHLGNFLEDQCSLAHIQGALVILSHPTGSVVVLYGPL
jgi:hypothetical protein